MVSNNILVKLSHGYEMNFSTFQTRKEKNQNILQCTLKYAFFVKQMYLTSFIT